jgi:hypothetical protein
VSLAKQGIAPGRLQDRFQQELRLYLEEQIVERLWAGDLTLWPKDLIKRDAALAKMEWLSAPEELRQPLELVRDNLQKADAEGLLDHGLLTFESVNLSARALLKLPGMELKRKVIVWTASLRMPWRKMTRSWI